MLLEELFMDFQIEWIIRIALATFFGAIIGYERHSRSKEAGIRTHMIVALGSAVFMILSKYGFSDMTSYDSARIAAQVVSGIGFLGAGIIFVRHDTIQGLTTAAGIWTTAAMAMCFGAGLYIIGICSGLMIIVIQTIFAHHNFVNAPRTTIQLLVKTTKDASIKDVTDAFKKVGYNCVDVRMAKDPEDSGKWVLYMEVTTLKDVEPALLLKEMREVPYITHIEIAE